MGYFSKAPIRLTAAIALSALVLASCDRTRIQKGYEYFPDMAQSLAHETYAPDTTMSTGITMQMPVLGSIPREMIPYTSGKFTIQPASLVSDRMLIAPIGEVYHVITMGWNTMGAHGPQIRPDDRWKIALYVKNTLQKNIK